MLHATLYKTGQFFILNQLLPISTGGVETCQPIRLLVRIAGHSEESLELKKLVLNVTKMVKHNRFNIRRQP